MKASGSISDAALSTMVEKELSESVSFMNIRAGSKVLFMPHHGFDAVYVALILKNFKDIEMNEQREAL